MSFSYTTSGVATFTKTHAKDLVFKVETDLKRIQRFYGEPSDKSIEAYADEAISLLRHGYLDFVWYGFRRHSQWIEPTLRYRAEDIFASLLDDGLGKVRPRADISGALFGSVFGII